jgi:heat shock 70kDa protein 1/2/6/8
MNTQQTESKIQTNNSKRTKEFPGCIGIDLGTTYSCVAVWLNDKVEIIPNDLGNRTTPSWVAFADDERLIGEEAKSQAASNPANTLFDIKRLIGRKYSDEQVQDDLDMFPFKVEPDMNDLPLIKVFFRNQERSYKPEQISAFVLEKMKTCAEEYLGMTVKKAVITVPAYFSDYQRKATQDAATIAGLNCMRIINEPTAACLCYGLDKLNDGTIMIYDLGGGTLDVSLLQVTGGVFQVLATSGNVSLGGENFDMAMVEHVLEQFELKHKADIDKVARKYATDKKKDGLENEDKEELGPRHNLKSVTKAKTACEKAKRALSQNQTATIEIDSFWEGIDYKLKITRAKFESLCADLLKQCMEPVRQVLQDAKLRKDQIDEAVLIGGSTRMPIIQQMLSDFLDGKTLNKSVNPDEAVAYGAAVQGAILSKSDKSGKTKDVVLLDVIPLSLGIETSGGIMGKIIERNSTVPIEKSKVFSTVEDNQETVLIKVFEGEREFTQHNNLLGTFELTDIPSLPRGVPKIEVTFEIDVNGILNVSAVEQSTGRNSRVSISRESGRLTQEEISRMVSDAEQYHAEDELRKAALSAVNSFEKYLDRVQKTVNNKDLNGQLSEQEIIAVNQYVINTMDWLNQNAPTASKDVIDQARMTVDHNLKDTLLKLFSRQEEIRKEKEREEKEASMYDLATEKIKQMRQAAESAGVTAADHLDSTTNINTSTTNTNDLKQSKQSKQSQQSQKAALPNLDKTSRLMSNSAAESEYIAKLCAKLDVGDLFPTVAENLSQNSVSKPATVLSDPRTKPKACTTSTSDRSSMPKKVSLAPKAENKIVQKPLTQDLSKQTSAPSKVEKTVQRAIRQPAAKATAPSTASVMKDDSIETQLENELNNEVQAEMVAIKKPVALRVASLTSGATHQRVASSKPVVAKRPIKLSSDKIDAPVVLTNQSPIKKIMRAS